MKKITVLGLWHQGIVGAACLADMGYDVIAADYSTETIKALNSGESPIYEPGLNELLDKGIKKGNLCFTDDLKHAVNNREAVLLMFDTPVDENDKSDPRFIFDIVKEIALHLSNEVLIYITSQVPVGSCDKIKNIIAETNPGLKFYISYSPENLRLGQAINRFLYPPLPVIGADDITGFEKTKNLFIDFEGEWHHIQLKSAEMVKHALNAFLATSVCFGNEIGNLCDELGVDGFQVAKALKMEERIGSKASILPGLGFSGGTLARDVQILRSFGDEKKLDTPFFDGLWKSNLHQNDLVKRKLKKVFGNLKGIKISVFGLTYKPDTSTLRRSASIKIIEDLLNEKAEILSHDPRADKTELQQYSHINFQEDPYDAVKDANALVLVTPWKQYKEINFNIVKTIMAPKPIIIDTANLWDSDMLVDLDFAYLNIGQGKRIVK